MIESGWIVAIVIRDGSVYDAEVFVSDDNLVAWMSEYGQEEDEQIAIVRGADLWQPDQPRPTSGG